MYSFCPGMDDLLLSFVIVKIVETDAALLGWNVRLRRHPTAALSHKTIVPGVCRFYGLLMGILEENGSFWSMSGFEEKIPVRSIVK
eukprot:scaffold1669_cov129-Cylindrotheca_fusiformis.AAC.61